MPLSFCFLFLNFCVFSSPSLISSSASFLSVSKFLSHLWFFSLSLSSLICHCLSIFILLSHSHRLSQRPEVRIDRVEILTDRKLADDFSSSSSFTCSFFSFSSSFCPPCVISLSTPFSSFSPTCASPSLAQPSPLCAIGLRHIHTSLLKDSLRWIHVMWVTIASYKKNQKNNHNKASTLTPLYFKTHFNHVCLLKKMF